MPCITQHEWTTATSPAINLGDGSGSAQVVVDMQDIQSPKKGSIARFMSWAVSAAIVFSVALIVLGLTVLGPTETGSVSIVAAGLVTITLALWISGAVPEFYSSLLFLFAASVFAVVPAERVFSGFHSSAMWLIFGGLILGHAVLVTGLGDRIVRRLLGFSPTSYARSLSMIALAGVCLAFVVPTAIGRVALIAPIAVQLAKQMGFSEGSSGRTGLVMAASMSTSLPAFTVLPSNVPNLVMSATADSLYGIHFSYGEYLTINFPVLGVFSVVAIVTLNWLLFYEAPPESSTLDVSKEISSRELRLAGILSLTVLLWISDDLHGVSAAWIAMGAALAVMSPAAEIISIRDLTNKINFAPMFFVAGVVGFGAVMSDTGLSDWVGSKLLGLFVSAELTSNAVVYATLVAVGVLVAVATTVPTAPPIMTPLAGQLSEATGWSIDSVLLAQVPTWVIIPFPYLVPPLLLSMSVGRIPSNHALRLMVAYFATGIVVIGPAHFLWGRFLGVFG